MKQKINRTTLKYKTKPLFGTSTFAFESRATDTAYTCISIHLDCWLCIQNHFRVEYNSTMRYVKHKSNMTQWLVEKLVCEGSECAMQCNAMMSKWKQTTNFRKWICVNATIQIKWKQNITLRVTIFCLCITKQIAACTLFITALLYTSAHRVQNNNVWNITPSNVHSNKIKLELHLEIYRGIEP